MKKKSVLVLFLFALITIAGFDGKNAHAAGTPFVSDSFDSVSGLWDYLGAAHVTSDKTVQLTSPNQSQAGSIWLKQPMSPPYDINFRMRMSEHSYEGSNEVPADGIVFMFNKNKATGYPSNNGMGFEPGNGYGVEFDTFYNHNSSDYVGGNHVSLFKNDALSRDNVINQVLSPVNMTNGQWHDVQIKVRTESVQVFIDGVSYVNTALTLDSTYNNLGFTASTGYYFSKQEIDAVTITKPGITRVYTTPSPVDVFTGSELSFKVKFDVPIVVDPGNLPRIQMNSSVESYADYVSGSGTDELTFRYLASESDRTPALNFKSEYAWTGTITSIDGLEVPHQLPKTYSPDSLAGTPVSVNMNTAAPYVAVQNVYSPSANTAFKAGDIIPIKLHYSDAVTVTGTPLLYMNTGKPAVYTAGSGSNELSFQYTAGSEDQIDGLNYWSVAALFLDGNTAIESVDPDKSVLSVLPLTTQSTSLIGSRILLDQTVPYLEMAVAPSETLGVPNVHLNATDLGGLTGVQIHFSLDGGGHWSDWEPYTTLRPFNLPSQTEPITISVQIKDPAGNESMTVSQELNPPVAAMGKALRLGSEMVLNENESLELDTVHDFTIAMWVYPASNVSQNLFYQPENVESPSRELSLTTSGMQDQVSLQFRGWKYDYETYYNVSLSSLNTIPVRQWSHIALVQHNGGFKLYINGVESFLSGIIQNNYPGVYSTPSLSPAFIGGGFWEGEVSSASAMDPYVGIDELQIWHRALLYEQDPNLTNRYNKEMDDTHPYYNDLAAYYKMDAVHDRIVPADKGTQNGLILGPYFSQTNNAEILPTALHHLQGQPLADRLGGSDEDEDPLTYHLVGNASRGTVILENAETGAFYYTTSTPAAGTDSFQYYVTDGILRSDTITVSIVTDSMEAVPGITGITTNPDSSVPTNQETMTVSVSVYGFPTAMKWLPGQAGPEDFLIGGYAIEGDSFLVDSNGIYTVYIANSLGFALQSIHIAHFDRDAPVITLNGEAEVEIWKDDPFEEPGFTVTDHDSVAPYTWIVGEVDIHTVGNYELKYTATDRAGNSSYLLRTVKVLARSNNADLSALSMDGYPFVFNPEVTEYTINVPYETTSVSLFYMTQDALATVALSEPEASMSLLIGSNPISVVVTAQNGAIKTYTVTVNRAGIAHPEIRSILLDPHPRASTSGTVNVTTSVYGEYLTAFKWLEGLADATAFVEGGIPIHDNAFSVYKNGLYTLYLENEIGSYHLKTFFVDQIDRIQPTLTLLGSNEIKVISGNSYPEPAFLATDDSELPVTIHQDVTVDVNTLGVYPVVFTAKDQAGNVSLPVTVTVTVVAPPLSSNADLSMLQVSGFTIPFDPNEINYTLTVNYDTHSVTVDATAADSTYASVTISGPYNDLQLGLNAILISVTAENGNKKNYTVNIWRETLPAPLIQTIVTMPDSVTPTKGNVTVTATVYGGHITSFKWLPGEAGVEAFISGGTPIAGGSFLATQNGTYTLFVQNELGAYALHTVAIANIDRSAPVLTLLGSSHITLNEGDTFVDPGYVKSDNLDTAEQVTVTTSGTLNTFVPAVYTLSYTAVDRAGNAAAVERVVTVVRLLSSNANLGALAPAGFPIGFIPSVMDYTINVPYETVSLPIHYSAADPNAAVTVTGAVYQAAGNKVTAFLNVGPNLIQWRVAAENGNEKTYTLNITRTGSSNAYIEQFGVLDGMLSPAFNSNTRTYELYVPGDRSQFISSLRLSDPTATFMITGTAYTVTGATYNTVTGSTYTVTGATYGALNTILFDFGSSTSFNITVLAADGHTSLDYHFELKRVPVAIQAVGYARMLDASTVQIHFRNQIAPGNLTLMDRIAINGAPAKVQGIQSVYTGGGTVQLELHLSQPISPSAHATISLVPGLLVSVPDGLPVTQLNVPIMNLEDVQTLFAQMDTLVDGLHIDDVLRYTGQSGASTDFNGDGQFDRNDMLFLLSLITNPISQ